MGKVRSKKWRGRNRPQPTGLPSVKETEQQLAVEGAGGQETADCPLLEKLASQSPSDRECGCRSLSHIVFDQSSVQLLMDQRVVRKLAPLLVDPAFTVREAAAGALRNLSVSSEGGLCEQMVQGDTMTPLSVMLRECVSELEKLQSQSMEDVAATGKEAKSRSHAEKVTQQQLVGIAEQGLHLLWNMSEHSSVVVDVFNQEGLLPTVLHLLHPDNYPPSLVAVAAQCLHTITEDNPTGIQLLCSSPDHLSFLEGLLAYSRGAVGWTLLIKTSIAGIFQNILPALSEPLHSQTLRGVLSVLAAVLETNVSPLIHTLSSTPPPTPPQVAEQVLGATNTSQDHTPLATGNQALLDDIQNCLSAQQLALEILANICYVESEGVGGEEEWEDEGEEEEMIGGDCDTMEAETTQQPGSVVEPSSSLSAIMELRIHEQVWKMCCSLDPTTYQACNPIENGDTIAKSLNTVHGRSLVALQNLLSALPVEAWGGGGSSLANVWVSLFTLLKAGGQFLNPDALTGALMVLLEKLNDMGVDCITLDQLQLVSQLGLTAGEPSVRADVMALLGTAGRMVLRHRPSALDMLTYEVSEEGRVTGSSTSSMEAIGCSLCDSIAKDGSLWVVSQALDSVFDVFGDDSCPPSVFVSVGLLPILKNTSSTFKARLRVEKKSLGPHVTLVQNSKLNLPRFIEYMNTRTRS